MKIRRTFSVFFQTAVTFIVLVLCWFYVHNGFLNVAKFGIIFKITIL